MSLAEELSRLEALRACGSLTDDEFQRAKARVLCGDAAPAQAPQFNRFRRSRTDRWLGGVCGGIAVISGVDSWVWRLMLTVLAIFGGTGVLLYILLWIFAPEDESAN